MGQRSVLRPCKELESTCSWSGQLLTQLTSTAMTTMVLGMRLGRSSSHVAAACTTPAPPDRAMNEMALNSRHSGSWRALRGNAAKTVKAKSIRTTELWLPRIWMETVECRSMQFARLVLTLLLEPLKSRTQQITAA